MPLLRAAARENAIGRLQAGQRQADVAHALNVSQSTISRLWQSGSTADAPRSGRPWATTPAQDRFIRLRHLCNRFLSAQSTVQALPGNQRISRQTVRNRIHGAGLRASRPYQGNVLTRRHRQARMLWANQHQAWTLRNHWRHVWFSDESRFLLQRHGRRRRVYRRRGERYAAPCVDEAPPHGGGGVTVWGAISNTGRSQLVPVQGNLTAAQYIQDILQPHVLPLMGTLGAVFQQDNARPHTARITVAYFNNQNIRTLPWPSLSPDLSPIEHCGTNWTDASECEMSPLQHQMNCCGAAGGLGDHPETDDPAPDSLHAAQMPGGDPGKWRPHPVLIFHADNGVPAESKGTKSGQFDWSDTLLSRHYRRLFSYSIDFVNFERSNVT